MKTEEAIYATAMQLKKINPDVKVTHPTSLDLCGGLLVPRRPTGWRFPVATTFAGMDTRLTHTWFLNPSNRGRAGTSL